jgi:hypothetical protein
MPNAHQLYQIDRNGHMARALKSSNAKTTPIKIVKPPAAK